MRSQECALLTIAPGGSLHASVLNMNRNRKIFLIAGSVFVFIIVLIAIDMARRTTAPWNRKKQIVRAFDVSAESDSITIDTLQQSH
jgi:hypothetical protein